MKILHIIEDFSLNGGGLRTVVKNLDFYLKAINKESYILSSNKENEDVVKILPSNNSWMYHKNWNKVITESLDTYKIDVVHIHGVWMYPQYLAAKICLKKDIPFVLTPHGMYEPWLWTKSRLKKKIYFKLLAKKIFSKAKYIHGITNDEILNLKKLFPTNKFIEIPNLISVKEKDHEVNLTSKYILYLGRLDPKKGIENLIKSFAKIDDKDLILKIAGGFNEYKNILEALIIDLNIKNRVVFLGMISGTEKQDIIKNAWVLAAPSYSEVIGMVNLEAASLKTPVITTYQTGLKREWSTNGGVLINPNLDELHDALEEVIMWSKEKRKKNGDKLFRFVEKEYSWEKKLIDWKELYQKTINI